jgi:K(+)-stimulated pyrophosphate-energized sodium pump
MSPIQAAAAAAGTGIDLTGGQLGLVAGVAFIAALALLVAGFLVREVLAASQGGPKMIEVGAAVQQGAAAYLRRQFRTLAA